MKKPEERIQRGWSALEVQGLLTELVRVAEMGVFLPEVRMKSNLCPNLLWRTYDNECTGTIVSIVIRNNRR